LLDGPAVPVAAGAAVPREVERDHGVPVLEVPHLVVPVLPVTPQAVNEHQRRPAGPAPTVMEVVAVPRPREIRLPRRVLRSARDHADVFHAGTGRAVGLLAR